MNSADIVIIGAGPAGISAAIQLKRYGLEPVLLEKNEAGGLLRNAHRVENYPGFPDGISGTELVELFKKHLENAGIEVQYEKVLKLVHKKGIFVVKTDRKEITCRMVIIASGTRPRLFKGVFIPEEAEKDIFYEIYPIRQINDKKIVIIGAGDAAFDYALNLAEKNEVIILNKGQKVKCLPLLYERSMATKNITYLQNAHIKKIERSGDEWVLTCQNKVKEWEMIVSHLVVAIGREPSLDFIGKGLAKKLEILERSKQLYLIGDVRNDIYRQTAISAGDGIRAAMGIYTKMKEEKN